MEKFKIEKKIGDGTYGSVLKALNTQTGEEVAIKQMKKKFASWDECINLREIKCLRKLNHPNLIKLKEVVKLHDELNLIFENLDQNIYQYYMGFRDKQQHIPEATIKHIIFQIVSGLAYMHKHGFFHRDLKPENILHQSGVVKIIDFGLAREIRSRPPYTDYVSTRWYRAPELLLRSTVYNSPVDIFAVGCIMAELYNLAPIFSGSNELDQLNKIFKVLGTPAQSVWPEGHKLASRVGISFSIYEKQNLEKVIPKASKDAIELLNWIFTFESTKRPTAQQILGHAYFAGFTESTNNNSNTPNTVLNNYQNSPNKAIKNFSGGEHLPELRQSNAFQKKEDKNGFNNYGILERGSVAAAAQNKNQENNFQTNNTNLTNMANNNKIPTLLPPKPQIYGSNNNLPSYIPSNNNFPLIENNQKQTKLPFINNNKNNFDNNNFYSKPPLPFNNPNPYNFNNPNSYIPNNNNFNNYNNQPNSYLQPGQAGGAAGYQIGNPPFNKPPRENNLQYAARNNLLNNFNMGNHFSHESTSMPPLGQRNQKPSFGGAGGGIGGTDKFNYNKYAF